MKRTSVISGIRIWGVVFGLWGLLMMACTTDPNDGSVEHNDCLQLNFAWPETRADLGEDGSGTFEEGDRIGLYIDNGSEVLYRELTLQGGEWLPRLTRKEVGDGRLTLAAHYPLLGGEEGATDRYAFDVAADQNGTGRDASDVLVSQAVVEEGAYRADMRFRHAMHRLRVELSGKAEGVEVQVRSQLGGEIDWWSGQAQATDGEEAWIVPMRNADGSYEAVIFPQSAAPYRDGEGVLLNVIVGGKTYGFKAPELQADGTPLTEFEAGRQVTVKLLLKEDETPTEPDDPVWANRKVWVYGITAPDESEWKQYFPEFFTSYALAWGPEYGWYDCNKRNPSDLDDGVPDGQMCWAATASNMLHWWFAQNKVYIDQYGKYAGPDYAYPLDKPQESDIFQCFVDSFDDRAGYADAGLNWFLHGEIPSYPSQDWPHNDGGYFKEVFPKGVRLGTNVGGLSKETFNKAMKDALSTRKAIGISIGPVRSGHIVTVWGAEFDENGDVSYIYFADNNDRDQFEQFGLGCYRYEISYESYPEGGTYVCYKSGFIGNDKPIVITRLMFLDLGEEYWQQYLAANPNE